MIDQSLFCFKLKYFLSKVSARGLKIRATFLQQPIEWKTTRQEPEKIPKGIKL
jgi:hypothetical protein